jgi:hypothetical protein
MKLRIARRNSGTVWGRKKLDVELTDFWELLKAIDGPSVSVL